MRKRGLQNFSGHFSKACSKRSRVRSSLVPPYENEEKASQDRSILEGDGEESEKSALTYRLTNFER